MSRPHGGTAHGRMGGLCEEFHWCPACVDGTGEPCQDTFVHPTCGWVACATGAPDEPVEGPS